MIAQVNIDRYIKLLYHNGELPFSDELKYLVDNGLLIKTENTLYLSPQWIALSHKLNENDFTRTILALDAELTTALLIKAKGFTNEIALKNDKKEIFSFVDSLPLFAKRLTDLKDIKTEGEDKLNYLLNGSISFQSVLRLLCNIQLITNKVTSPCIQDLSNEPDHNWINGRIISTAYPAKASARTNKFVMTCLDINNESIAPETKMILSQPWETFLVILGMIKSDYLTENEDGFTMKPESSANALNIQQVLVTISSQSGKTRFYGNLKSFTAELCASIGILLFPDKEPDLDKALIGLLDRSVFCFNGTEYLLGSEWHDRIYNRERFFKNKSRSLRKMLRSEIDKMRETV